MSISTTLYKRTKLVSEKANDGDFVFLNHDKGSLITISRTGMELLKFFNTPKSVDQVLALLREKYINVSSDEVNEVVTEMVNSGLITRWIR